METGSKRIAYLDIAKGIAIICIILGHLGIAKINRVVFTFHVPIFFLIMGYFTDERRSLGDTVKNKARTLLVPYLITCLAIILLGTLLEARSGQAGAAFRKWVYAAAYGAGDNYKKPFYIKGIGAIWFLWASFWGILFLRIGLNFSPVKRVLWIGLLFALGSYTRRWFWFPLSIQAGACAASFMYAGWLLRGNLPQLRAIPEEGKTAFRLFALLIWALFIKDFQSFWLVHCDVGRGAVDIFGCLCACYLVVLGSKRIEDHLPALSRPLAYLGRYSLLVLCVHIIELDLFPWKGLTARLIGHGMAESLQMPVIIAGKLCFDLTAAVLLSKSRTVRKLFGYKESVK